MACQLEEKYKNKIIAVLSALIPNGKIILFGSRARGTNTERSDIDIAVDAGSPLPRRDIDEAISMFQESNIPYRIEIVDFHHAPQLMQEAIKKEGIIWKS